MTTRLPWMILAPWGDDTSRATIDRFKVIVDGVEYVTDRYVLIRRDLLPAAEPAPLKYEDGDDIVTQRVHRAPAPDPEAVGRILRGGDPDPDPARLSPFYAHMITDHGFTIGAPRVTNSGTSWRIRDAAGELVGAVQSRRRREPGVLPGEDTVRLARIAAGIAFTFPRLRAPGHDGLRAAWEVAEVAASWDTSVAGSHRSAT